MMFSVGMFGLLMILIFTFFEWGSRSFYLASKRQGIQADGLRVMTGLKSDLRRTAKGTVSIEHRTSAVAVGATNPDRDALVVGGLQNWADASNSNNFDLSSGQPKWNRYVVYYATTGEANGKIYRVIIDPSPPPISPKPIGPGLLGTINDAPDTNLFQGTTPGYVLLSENVEEFACEDDGNGHFRVSLKLRSKRPARPGGAATTEDEVYQLKMSVATENSYPAEN